MKVKTIPSSWLRKEGRRFDCGPYLAGGLEAKLHLEELDAPKDTLQSLTAGYNGGIFNGPKFSRTWVKEAGLGVPFLGSAAMLRADLSSMPLLRKADAESSKLSYLQAPPTATLISCSGTIGRMVFCRDDMGEHWTSQHIMKVVPNPKRIRAGYLYAFLRSKFGVPMIISGTYGSIIQSIEPRHIENLPVPRLGPSVEDAAADLVDESAHLLEAYQRGIIAATERFFESVGLADITTAEWHEPGSDVGFAETFPRVESFRALNFNPRFKALCDRIRQGPWKSLGEICEPGTLKRGGRFKRIDAEPEHAYQLVGQKQLFWLRPEGRWIAKWALGNDVLVDDGTILVAARGTLGETELYCRSEFIWGPATGRAYSEDILRVISDPDVMPRGCLYAYMRSEMAFRQLRSVSVGTKIQDHHYTMLAELPVPYPGHDVQEEVHEMMTTAYDARHRGVALEEQAIALVEQAVEEAS